MNDWSNIIIYLLAKANETGELYVLARFTLPWCVWFILTKELFT